MNEHKNFELLYDAQTLAKAIKKMAQEIEASYKPDDEIICVGILKGAFVFLADLVRNFSRPVKVDFVQAVSYGRGTKSSGTVRLLKDIEIDLSGKHILLIDEMIDTGRTLLFLKNRFDTSKAESVKLVALFDKKECREVAVEADFVGIECPNQFLVGYGLDWAERFRELPEVYSVPPELTNS